MNQCVWPRLRKPWWRYRCLHHFPNFSICFMFYVHCTITKIVTTARTLLSRYIDRTSCNIWLERLLLHIMRTTKRICEQTWVCRTEARSAPAYLVLIESMSACGILRWCVLLDQIPSKCDALYQGFNFKNLSAQKKRRSI